MTEIRVKALLGWPALVKPTSINNGPLKFRARLGFDPDAAWGKDSIKLIRDTRKAVAKEKWKGKAEGILDFMKGDRNKESWFESDYKSQEGDVHEGFAGLYHLSTLNEIMPLLLDNDRTELDAQEARQRFYSGCYVAARVDIYPQDNEHGRGMRAGLMGVQFWKDGTNFGGGKKAKVDDFEDLSDTGEDDEPEEKPRPKASAKRKPEPVDEDEYDIA